MVTVGSVILGEKAHSMSVRGWRKRFCCGSNLCVNLTSDCLQQPLQRSCKSNRVPRAAHDANSFAPGLLTIEPGITWINIVGRNCKTDCNMCRGIPQKETAQRIFPVSTGNSDSQGAEKSNEHMSRVGKRKKRSRAGNESEGTDWKAESKKS